MFQTNNTNGERKMYTNGDDSSFAKKYLSDIKAAWALSSNGNPWWMKCQCGFTHVAVFDVTYDAAYCSNCFTWLSSKCSDLDGDYCADSLDKAP